MKVHSDEVNSGNQICGLHVKNVWRKTRHLDLRSCPAGHLGLSNHDDLRSCCLIEKKM